MLVVWAGLGLAARAYAQGVEQPLLSFGSANQAGQYPEASLIQGADGALYGTTSDGGAGTNGTVFRIGTNGFGYTVLHTFSSTGGDGRHPRAGLVRGSDGALYGTTSDGGSSDHGTVFKLNPDGSGYSVLHSFTGSPADGSNPEAELIQGNDGAFYGTACRGGAFRGTTRETLAGFGTVFKLNGDGSGYTLLYSFGGSSEKYLSG